jgi:hypothetical protein
MKTLIPLLGFLPVVANAAPVAPMGSDPSGFSPASGALALYGTAGLPAGGVGADLGLWRTQAGIEATVVAPGALRTEVHARWPFSPSSLVLGPRLSLAYSVPLRERFQGIPADPGGEVGMGFFASCPLARVRLFVDVGALAFSDLAIKQKVRLFGTAAAGVSIPITSRIVLAAHGGALYTRRRLAPAVGLTVSLLVLP